MTETQTHIDNAERSINPVNKLPSVKFIKLLTQQVVTVALDLVFPPHCVNCQRVGGFLCERCAATVQAAPERAVAGLDSVRAAVRFEGAASTAIHAFKYERQTHLVRILGLWLCHALEPVGWQIDCVTAVPLHETRLAARGYNQAALLARHVADTFSWDFDETLVRRVRETPSQVNLNMHERRVNVAGAFVAQPGSLAGRRVLVIDDVLTTGATLAACADALRGAGAAVVYGAAAASAVFVE